MRPLSQRRSRLALDPQAAQVTLWDEAYTGKTKDVSDYIREAVVAPGAFVASGCSGGACQKGLMPAILAKALNDQELGITESQHKRDWQDFMAVTLRDAGQVASIDGGTFEVNPAAAETACSESMTSSVKGPSGHHCTVWVSAHR